MTSQNIYSPQKTTTLQTWVHKQIQAQQPFAIRGANSRLPAGETPILSTKKLKDILFFDPNDMVIGVEAGLPVATLQGILQEKKMHLPVNPWHAHSTIGSVVACNDFGPHRMNGGGLRDFIIGMEYINGKGEAVKAGGRVVKNVTGYDLSRMMLGSLGGLGVITSVNFKINPEPAGRASLVGVFKDASWLEKIQQAHMQRIPMDWIQATTTDSGWVLGVGFSGIEARQNRIAQDLQEIFSKTLEPVPENQTPQTVSTPLGTQLFSGFLPPLLEQYQPVALHLHGVLSTKEMLTQLDFQALREQGADLIIHPIGGDFHLLAKEATLKSQQNLVQALKAQLRGTSGTISLVASVAGLGVPDLVPHAKPKAHGFMQALKNQLDPSRIFHAPFYED